ncbi:MAG: DUF6291 domain-containing protein [Nitrosotalea sp.]
MENKKSFIFYTEWKEMFKSLDTQDAGELINAIFSYQSGEEINLPRPLMAAFILLKQTLDRDGEKYEKERVARSEAGKRGMKNRWNNKSITKHKSVIPAITKITDNDNVYDNDNNKSVVNHNSSLSYLTNIPVEDINTFYLAYDCTKNQITALAESLMTWCQSKARVKKNYRAFLQNRLLAQYGKREDSPFKRL